MWDSPRPGLRVSLRQEKHGQNQTGFPGPGPRTRSCLLGDQVVWGVRSEGRSRDAVRQGGGRAQRPLLLGRDREVLL